MDKAILKKVRARETAKLGARKYHRLYEHHCEGCFIHANTKQLVRYKPHRTTKGLHWHHLKPLCQGGSNADGVVRLCYNCHRQVHTINGVLNWAKVDPFLTDIYQAIYSHLYLPFL